MKKRGKYLLIGLGIAVLLTGAMISLGIWALNSAEGTRVLFKTISIISPLQIDAQEIQGRLRDRLNLQGVRIRWGQGEIRADQLQLNWQPAELWNRQLILNELFLKNTVFYDRAPESQQFSLPGWPQVPFWLSKVQAKIESFRIQGFVYQRHNQDPLQLGQIRVRAQWDGNLLEIGDFNLNGPSGQAEGNMKLSLTPPSMNLSLSASLTKEYAGLDHLAVKLALEQTAKPEEAAGTIWASGQKRNAESLRLEGELGLTRSALTWRNLRIWQPGRKGVVESQGSWGFAVRPSLEGRLNFSEVNLGPDLGVVTDLSGQVDMKGLLDNYRGQIFLTNKAKGLHQGKVSAEFQGDLRGIRINKLDASWLDGMVRGDLGFSWAKGFAVESRIQGSKLNPGRFHSDWKGEVNLNLEGRILWQENQLSEAAVKANFSESRIRGQLFNGELNASVEKEFWKIAQLRLRGQGFTFQAQGVLQEKLNLNTHITDLSKLMPDAKGQLVINGWVRYRENQMSGAFQGQGSNLLWSKIRVGSLAADLKLKESSVDSPLAFGIESRLENLQADSFLIKALALESSGFLKSHKANLTLQLDKGEIQGQIEGGYENGAWKGRVAKLTGKDTQGLWTLQAPTQVQISAEKFLLDPLTVKSTHGERLQAAANLALGPALGSIRVEWGSLDLGRLNPWLSNNNLSGQTTGALSVHWRKSGMQINGETSMNGIFVRDQIKVDVVLGKARCDWNEKGLLSSLTLNLRQGGNLDVRVSWAEAVQADFPQSGKIEAKWKGIDHLLFSPAFPREFILKGQSSGQVTGQWHQGFQVEAAGGMKVSRTEVTWQKGEKPVSVAIQKADLDFNWRADSLQGGIALALVDHGMLKGNFLLPLTSQIWPFFRSEGGVKVTLNGQLQEKGFLSTFYPEMISKSRGNIDLNFNADGTWGNPRFKGALNLADTAIQFSHGRENRQIGNGPDPLNLELSSGSAAMEWGDLGLRSSITLEFKNHGRVEGKLSSSEPSHFSFPNKGQMELSWSGLDVSLVQPLAPKQLSLEGRVAGQIRGNWLPDYRLETTGELKLTKGKLSWRGEGGLISAEMNQGAIDFSWKGENLQGNLSLSLESYGSLQGNFWLPIPAKIPFQVDPNGNIRAVVRGQAQENGLLSAIFPGMIQESRGNLDLDLQLDGTWKNPNPKGAIQLTNAGAFLPGLGIRVEDLSTRCRLQNDQLQIESFQAKSGPGRIDGSGNLWLKNGEIQRYDGKISGDKFQTFYLTELRIQSSPKLNFSGDSKGLSIRGEVLLPEVLIQGVNTSGTVRPSSDIVIVDQPSLQTSSFSLDMQVRIDLGDRVTFKAEGVDARLAGSLDLQAGGVRPNQITARGEIRVVEGTYTGYGFNLRIERGRFIFAGGPVDNPALDILALRRSEDLESGYDVKVGITILGNLKRPNIKLYSTPAMKDEDILAYIVTGRPYDRQSANLSFLWMGAGALVSGDSSSSVEQLKKKVGIDKVDIESQSGDVSRSMITVGKYLTPQLYISYGYSIFDSSQALKLRYKISKRWEVEAARGSAMAMDLFYRIEFF